MAAMVITTKAETVDPKKAETVDPKKAKAAKTVDPKKAKMLDSNLRSAQLFLTKLQAQVEQMRLNSEQDRNNWNEVFCSLENQIPKELLPEVKKVLKKGVSQIKALMKPENTWDMLQDIYCKLNCTMEKLKRAYS